MRFAQAETMNSVMYEDTGFICKHDATGALLGLLTVLQRPEGTDRPQALGRKIPSIYRYGSLTSASSLA
jgi:hypothetical protein